jgi:rare lipoprotein A
MLVLRVFLIPLLALSLTAAAPWSVSDPIDSDTEIAMPTIELAPEEEEAPAVRNEQFEQFGVASWYGGWHHGRPTASGARFDMNQLTAAHRSLPLGTAVRVTNLANGRTVDVMINDRGPYVHGRVIDLSRRAASDLAMIEAGLAAVRIEALPPVIEARDVGNAERTVN